MKQSGAGFVFEHRGHCPTCDRQVTFRAAHAWFRDHLLCDACGSIPRERALMRTIMEYYPNWRELSIHETSPVFRGASARLREQCPQYSSSYYYPDLPPGQVHAVSGSRCENLEQLTFPDASFDLFISQDVMEHILDPEAAFREIARVLKPGGAHIFTVPLINKTRPSEVWASRDGDGRIIHHHQPEYHGDPTTERGSLVTMHWGYDLATFITTEASMPTLIVATDDIDQGIRAEYIEVLVSVKMSVADEAAPC